MKPIYLLTRGATAALLLITAGTPSGAPAPTPEPAQPEPARPAPTREEAIRDATRRYRDRYSGYRGLEGRFSTMSRRGRNYPDPDPTRRATLSNRANRIARKAESLAREGRLSREQLELTQARLLPVWDVVHNAYTIETRTWKDSRAWLDRIEETLKKPERVGVLEEDMRR